MRTPRATSRSANAIRNASSMAVNLSPEEVAARGGNKSLIHIDWMIGSGEIDVDGINKDGSVVPVMRKGEWV